jgi:hypothetical protein
MVSRVRTAGFVGCCSFALLAQAPRPADLAFTSRMIDPGASETVALADIDGDGRLDIVSGDSWYRAPDWTKHTFRTIGYANQYVDVFSDHALDVNGDGRPDIVSASWFARRIWWNEHPGGDGTGTWKEHDIATDHPVEFAFLVDLDNDGVAQELLPQFGDTKAPLTWYKLANGHFVPHVVANRSFGHGIGAGDVNGDGRTDILTPKGWLEAPARPDGTWTLHESWDLGQTGFLHVLDVNGDGRPDVVTSMAHDYGIFWLEQRADGTWTKHMIDDTWSQAHATTLVDLNGDGQLDLVTGKRYMAHNGRDPGEREPLGLYWYQYRRRDDGSVEWIRHLVDYGSRAGGGMQVRVVPLTAGVPPSIIVGGKSGLFIYEQSAR